MAINGGSPNARPVGCGPDMKVCAACGETFSCAARAAGCWCEEMELTKEALIELCARYSDCLCPRCLSAAASQPVRKTQ